jgi:hypothetical protein
MVARSCGSLGALLALAGAVALSSCKDPLPGFSAGAQAKSKQTPTPQATGPAVNEDCPMGDDWFPTTAPVRMFDPPPHPDTECPFYRGAYQNYLIATQELSKKGRPMEMDVAARSS